MAKRALLAVAVLVSSAVAAYALDMLDKIVHGTLYQYGLQFNLDWANPYWTLLRVIQALLSVIAVAASVDVLLTVRAHFSERSSRAGASQVPKAVVKTPVITRSSEKPPIAYAPPSKSSTITAPSSVRQPERVSVSKPSSVPVSPVPIPFPASTRKHADTSGSFQCPHCRKTFTQPLRMLDFQGDRPRIVNICPFCNEIIASVQREEEEKKTRDDTYQLDKGDYVPRTKAQ